MGTPLLLKDCLMIPISNISCFHESVIWGHTCSVYKFDSFISSLRNNG